MVINNRDRQRTRVVFVPVATGGGGGSQAKIKVGENGIKFCYSTFTEVPDIFDFSDVTNIQNMFQYCYSLTTAPEMNTSNIDNFYNLFSWCVSLTTLQEMETSNVTWMGGAFDECTSLTDLGGFVGLKCDLSLSSCPLTHDSLMNVINKAADVTAAPATLTLGSDNLAKLSDEEKGIATAKGWTLA